MKVSRKEHELNSLEVDMKTVLVVIILIAACLGAGYFGIPVLIDRQTAPLKTEIEDLKNEIQKMKKESRVAPLQPTADAGKIIAVVNSLTSRMTALEDSFKKSASATDKTIRDQKKTTEEALKKQSEAAAKMAGEAEAKIRRNTFYSLMSTVRGNVLKAKLDLAARNVGTAKNDLEPISGALEKAKSVAEGEKGKVVDELQGILKKATADIDTDLPSAINRIDLLWNEVSKVLRKE
jgi:DNA repair exonuclease SbcCD ATPase subunit